MFLPWTKVTPEVTPEIWFSKFNLEKTMSKSSLKSKIKSHRVSIILLLHIPFVLNQLAHLFLKCRCFKIPTRASSEEATYTKAAVVAQRVAQRRQSGGRTIAKVAQGLPWSPNGSTVVATVIAQWTLLVGQRRHTGGTRKAEASLKSIDNVHNSTHFLWGDQWPTTVHPFSDHGDVCAFLLPHLSHLWATDLLGDLCAIILNMLKTSRRPWHPWRCLNALCTTLERLRRPFGLLSAFNGDLASFVVAQGRHRGRSPCVKGV